MGQGGRDRENGTGRTEQGERVREDGTGRMGQGGRDRKDGTGRTTQGGRDREDGTRRTGQGGRNKEDKQREELTSSMSLSVMRLMSLMVFCGFLADSFSRAMTPVPVPIRSSSPGSISRDHTPGAAEAVTIWQSGLLSDPADCRL